MSVPKGEMKGAWTNPDGLCWVVGEMALFCPTLCDRGTERQEGIDEAYCAAGNIARSGLEILTWLHSKTEWKVCYSSSRLYGKLGSSRDLPALAVVHLRCLALTITQKMPRWRTTFGLVSLVQHQHPSGREHTQLFSNSFWCAPHRGHTTASAPSSFNDFAAEPLTWTGRPALAGRAATSNVTAGLVLPAPQALWQQLDYFDAGLLPSVNETAPEGMFPLGALGKSVVCPEERVCSQKEHWNASWISTQGSFVWHCHAAIQGLISELPALPATAAPREVSTCVTLTRNQQWADTLQLSVPQSISPATKWFWDCGVLLVCFASLQSWGTPAQSLISLRCAVKQLEGDNMVFFLLFSSFQMNVTKDGWRA